MELLVEIILEQEVLCIPVRNSHPFGCVLQKTLEAIRRDNEPLSPVVYEDPGVLRSEVPVFLPGYFQDLFNNHDCIDLFRQGFALIDMPLLVKVDGFEERQHFIEDSLGIRTPGFGDLRHICLDIRTDIVDVYVHHLKPFCSVSFFHQCKRFLSVNDNCAFVLGDGLIDDTALLDSAGRWSAAPE